jgi:hypothetical protein
LIDFSHLGFKHSVVLLENGGEKFWKGMIRLALSEDGHLLIEIVGVDDMGPGFGTFVEFSLAEEDDGLDFTPPDRGGERRCVLPWRGGRCPWRERIGIR